MKNLKGRCVFAQSGGPTTVINASIAGGLIEALDSENITGVLCAHHGIKGVLDEDFFDISAEDRAELEAKYDQLLRESNISKYKAKYLGMGYEEKLAESTAEAMVDGDTDKVFANQKKHLEAVDKKIRAEVLKDTPKPTGDGDNPGMTLDKFRALPAMEREDWARQNPEEYRSLYTANDTGGNQ